MCSSSLFPAPSSRLYFTPCTHSGHIQPARTEVNTFRARYPPSPANTNTSRAALSPHKHARTNIQAQWKSIVQRRRRPMKNACPLACFIRNTHRDSIHISAEKPHRNINYARNLGGSVGRTSAEREYGIRGVILMRGSLSPAGLGATLLV